jgi:hypothetical protein
MRAWASTQAVTLLANSLSVFIRSMNALADSMLMKLSPLGSGCVDVLVLPHIK